MPHCSIFVRTLRICLTTCLISVAFTSTQITNALLGANSRKARFVAAEAKLNSAHQLVDRWNHPYFFHQLSRAHMEIRSAGPDGVLWTSDDELSR